MAPTAQAHLLRPAPRTLHLEPLGEAVPDAFF